MNRELKKLTKCLCCDSKNLVLALDLNKQPLANSYLKNANEEEASYPLSINYCMECTHVQLTHAVNPDLLFKNYLYVSGTTKTLLDYFDWFVDFTAQFTNGKKVLDIACNDGSQLNSFKKKDYKTFGIDPAANLFELSSKNHNVVCAYFDKKNVKKFNTKFDIIVAQNVLAHNSYPQKFLKVCSKFLEPGGKIFIQTSQADMILNHQFDTIYHEHISFFSVKSVAYLAKKAGLNLVDVKRTPVHGTSFVFIFSKDEPDRSEELISKETIITSEHIEQYSRNCRDVVNQVLEKINQLKASGVKIVGYGAAAKGNTFINFSKLKLDYIVDDNPLKHNLFTPGSKIPIFSPDKLLEEKLNKICVIPLAWNFFEEIKNRVSKFNLNDVVYLKYYPKTELC